MYYIGSRCNHFLPSLLLSTSTGRRHAWLRWVFSSLRSSSSLGKAWSGKLPQRGDSRCSSFVSLSTCAHGFLAGCLMDEKVVVVYIYTSELGRVRSVAPRIKTPAVRHIRESLLFLSLSCSRQNGWLCSPQWAAITEEHNHQMVDAAPARRAGHAQDFQAELVNRNMKLSGGPTCHWTHRW